MVIIMNKIALILYFSGLGLMLITIIIVIIRATKDLKLFNIFILFLMIIALSSLSLGAVLSFVWDKDKNSEANEPIIPSPVKDNPQPLTENKEALLKKLNVSIEFRGLSPSNKNNILVVVNNDSDFEFDGNITLKVKDFKDELLDSINIELKNIPSKGTTSRIIQADPLSKKSEYTIDGEFKESKNKLSSSNYTINDIKIGKEYITFDVITDNPSNKDELIKIIKEFKSVYNSEVCSGFFIFFYSEANDDMPYTFGNAESEFYINYKDNTSMLSIYKTKQNIKEGGW